MCVVKERGGYGSRKRRQRIRKEQTRDKNNDRDTGYEEEYENESEYSLDTIDSNTLKI